MSWKGTTTLLSTIEPYRRLSPAQLARVTAVVSLWMRQRPMKKGDVVVTEQHSGPRRPSSLNALLTKQGATDKKQILER